MRSTPIETYSLSGKTIYVKREDLCCIPPLPPLAKLRGAEILLQKLKAKGVGLIGNLDTRFSKSGLGISIIAKGLGLQCILGYPDNGVGPMEWLKEAEKDFGASLFPIRPNYFRVTYSRAKAHVQSLGGTMLPIALSCEESVMAVADEARTIPTDLLEGTLVICVGSGTMLSGVIHGLTRFPNIIGVSVGMSLRNQMSVITKYLPTLDYPSFLKIVPPFMPYSMQEHIATPFPAHPTYDKKAWRYLVEHLDELREPILFWNIGA